MVHERIHYRTPDHNIILYQHILFLFTTEHRGKDGTFHIATDDVYFGADHPERQHSAIVGHHVNF